MADSFIERQVQNALLDMVNNKATRIVKGIGRIAAMQGGESTIQNYQLLGKRVLIIGAVIVVVQAASSAVSFVISRKREEQRIERVVRRVLEEERQKAEAETEA